MSEATQPYAAKLRTPFAVLGVRTDGRAVTRLCYLPRDERAAAPTDAIAERAVRELERYLDDPQFRFTVPLAPGGTPFQLRVWQALAAIAPGQSRTYGEIARLVRSAPRAVGQACGANRIALVIPCHRVVGALGALGGFMGTAGPPQGARPPGGVRRAAPLGGDLFSTAGPPQGARPPGGMRRAAPLGGEHSPADEGDPVAIKRWLLAHEGYRFGA